MSIGVYKIKFAGRWFSVFAIVYMIVFAVSGAWRDILITNPIIPVRVGECVIRRLSNCRGVNLEDTDLTDGCLSRVDLTDADLRADNLAGSLLKDAIFCNATMPDWSANNSGCTRRHVSWKRLTILSYRGSDMTHDEIFDLSKCGSTRAYFQ